MDKVFITRTTVKCPHCGVDNSMLIFGDQLGKMNIACCDVEQGGCTEEFAYMPLVYVEVQVFKFQKVEEE